MALKFVLILALAAIVRAQLPTLGSCPDYKAVENFDLDKFLGKWYEYERYYSVYEAGTICSQIEYSKSPDGRIIAANSITARFTGINRVLNGELKLADPTSKSGKIAIRYEQLPLAINSAYSVLATDYNSYAILWSCSAPVPYIVNMQNAWLMTRESKPSNKTLEDAHNYFNKLGIRPGYLQLVDQSCVPPTTAPAAAPVAAEAPVVEAPSGRVHPAVRNQQVHVKPEVNAVDVEDSKPVVQDPEVPVVPEVPLVPEAAVAVAPEVPVVPEVPVPADEPVKEAVEEKAPEKFVSEPEKSLPEPEKVEPEPEKVVPEPEKLAEPEKVEPEAAEPVPEKVVPEPEPVVAEEPAPEPVAPVEKDEVKAEVAAETVESKPAEDKVH